MRIPPHYVLTAKISEYLQGIEAAKAVIDSFSLPSEVETNIRRQSILKSSLFSARIEGNPLTLDELSKKPSSDQKKQEVFNILKGLEFIQERGSRNLTLSVILQTHEKVMSTLIDKSSLGKFRKEVSAIFNVAGIAVYLPPPPTQVNYLMQRLIVFVNSDKEPFVPIRAALAHYTFEKIHPFLDGNGRIGRLLLQGVLEKGGYGMKGLTGIEEYLDSHRSAYYDTLTLSDKDVTEYLEFILLALSQTAQKAKKLVLSKEKITAEDYLLPRRAEILYIIKDHVMVNFDQIRRRFMAVNERTLRYDLKKLADAGLIRKRGTTKGVYYEILNPKF